jgi:hypothetical protein
MSSAEPQDGRLEIHGEAKDGCVEGLSVECPYRGTCAVSVCMRCADFTGLSSDPTGRLTHADCRKAEAAPKDRFSIVERRIHVADKHWTVTAYGRQRGDGTWDGWLEWRSSDRETTRCGGCETNERSREALQAWAEGLSAWSSRGLHIACEVLEEDD